MLCLVLSAHQSFQCFESLPGASLFSLPSSFSGSVLLVTKGASAFVGGWRAEVRVCAKIQRKLIVPVTSTSLTMCWNPEGRHSSVLFDFGLSLLIYGPGSRSCLFREADVRARGECKRRLVLTASFSLPRSRALDCQLAPGLC